MATFYNQATLTYNDTTTNSNIVTGELVEVLTAAKTAVTDSYSAGDTLTYIVSIVNSGCKQLTDLTVTDNLGSYQSDELTLVPLTYVEKSVKYYVNGVRQHVPKTECGPMLVFSGINVPADGNVLIIYSADVNNYAPLTKKGKITNQVTVSGSTLSSDITACETVNTVDEPVLSISKAICPAAVTENGQLTYTFLIQNTGNTAADECDNAVITDTFDPILNPITVTFNGKKWTEGKQYTYNEATGEFATIAGKITVPAATFEQDATTGRWIVTPGVSTLTVTGTI